MLVFIEIFGTESIMNALERNIEKSLKARHPLLFLHTHEENRVMESLRRLADGNRVICWTCTEGLEGFENGATVDPVEALREVIRNPGPGFYIFKDLTEFLDNPAVVRMLRDAYQKFRGFGKTHLFIVSPVSNIPEALEKSLFKIEIPPPTTEDLLTLVTSVLPQYTQQSVPDGMLRDIALSLKGITLDEAEHVIHGVLSGSKLSRTALLSEIRKTKKTIAAHAGFLEYVPSPRSLEHVGGLSNLKAWISERARVFNQNSVDKGLPVPGGVLIMGVSGCGKSLCAKVVANIWNVPLFRLDMNLIFSDLHGNPEAAFHKSLRAVESLAPAVLWVDEIENGLGFTEKTSSIQSHIFSAFLTWMQEKPPLVFVAATANHIEILPAELIRKGRFDQVFFVDLPDDDERAELFRIHILLNDANPDTFNMKSLILETHGWNGAEIEQVVNAARIHAHQENRAFNTDDIVEHTRMIVPLSRTMHEQIKTIKDWAWDRATPASEGKGTDYSILDSVSNTRN